MGGGLLAIAFTALGGRGAGHVYMHKKLTHPFSISNVITLKTWRGRE